jgi:outer membrane immunogenic protein
MMKNALLTAAALMAISSAAHAADAPAPVANWTGVYIGANVGLAGGDFDYGLDYDFGIVNNEFQGEDYSAGLLGDFGLDSSGLFAGGQIGFNYQIDQIVLGAEADFQWSGLEGDLDASLTGTSSAAPSSIGAGVSAGSEVDWFGTLRLRAGWAVTDNFLPYITGGAAYGKVKSSYNINYDFGGLGGPSGSWGDSTSDTQWGWTLGAGAEYMITDNWTFKAEYLYVDLGKQTLYSGGLLTDLLDPPRGVTVSDDLKIDVDTKFHTFKVGVNYKFW